MKKKILLLIGLFSIGIVYAQIGINTQNIQAMLQLKSLGNTISTKALSVIDNNNKEVLTVLDNGYIGLGVSNPRIALDLRDNTDGAIVGIGSSNATASVVGAGTIKYESIYGSLFVSNGTSWSALQSSIQKATVIAEIQSSSQTFAANGMSIAITGWSKLSDSFNSFDISTGVFKAPHNGLYTVSVMLNFNPVTVAANSNIELNLLKSTGLEISGITTYPAAGTCSVYARCSGSVSLSKDETITIMICNNLGSPVSLISNKQYNKLSITES